MKTTTLENEIARMVRVVEQRVADFKKSFKGGRLTLADQLTQLIQKASRSNLDPVSRAGLEEVVKVSLDRDLPIPFAFLWAMGGQARSQFKFCEPHVALPRLGDYWMFFWLSMLSRKIQHVYTPGIEVVVADEVPQLELLGFTREEIRNRRAPLERVAKQYTAFVRIVELPYFNEHLDQIPEPTLTPELVFAIVSCLEWSERVPLEVYNTLYQQREKPWDSVRSAIPKCVWDEASRIQRAMIRIGEARKRTRFFDQFFGGRPYIDGAITDKGRWSPDAWSLAFPQHGGSVLDATDTRYSVKIVPESRLLNNGHEPVRIRSVEMGADQKEEEYTFYWTKKVSD